MLKLVFFAFPMHSTFPRRHTPISYSPVREYIISATSTASCNPLRLRLLMRNCVFGDAKFSVDRSMHANSLEFEQFFVIFLACRCHRRFSGVLKFVSRI